MKILGFLLALSCAIVYASASLPRIPLSRQSIVPLLPYNSPSLHQADLRLEEPNRDSITFHGTQPLGEPQRQPIWDFNANASGLRFRREAQNEPNRGSITFQATQPLSGPQRQPTWDLNANANVFNSRRTTADVYGGLGKTPGQRVQPHFGIQAERNFGNNGFVRGHTQFQPGPRGHGLSPSVGITGGFRFRRETKDTDQTELAEKY